MIIRNFIAGIRNQTAPEILSLPELVEATGLISSSGQTVTGESAKNLATAFRCINVLSDDFAKMPFQTFLSQEPGKIERLRPSSRMQNIAWLLEVSPNRWMVPFVFKKTLMEWLLVQGNAYAWMPVPPRGARREIFILNAAATRPFYDDEGYLWYQTTFRNGRSYYLPDVEVLHMMINSMDGINGRSVITYARESLGRQLGAYETQGKFYAQGLNPGGIIWMAGDLDKEARNKVRDSYQEAMSGSGNAYRLAVMDQKVTKFEAITMKPVDVQFLEGIAENDVEIANFFGMPLYKLNMGKQAYNSNEQQNLDYLNTTLDPYLVQMEEAAKLRWLSEEEQGSTYFRFNRDVLLRTDAKTRAENIKERIFSGTLTPNEARQIEDMSAFEGGDAHYVPANMAMVLPDGRLSTGSGGTENNHGDSNNGSLKK